MNAPDNIYIGKLAVIALEKNEKIRCLVITNRSSTNDIEYIRHDKYAALEAERDNLRSEVERLKNAIKQQASSAKMGMEASRAVGVESLRIAEKLNAESKPEVIDSEREANAMLTEENLRLEQENDQLRARLDDLVFAAKNQMCAQGNEAECWDGLHSCCKPELRDAIMRIKPPASAENENV